MRSLKKSVIPLFNLYGVVMTADSLVGIPAVSVMVKGQNRGTITNDQGVFSIVVLKGDELNLPTLVINQKSITIPRNLEGNQYSIVQLMVTDTVYLPATIIRPRPTPEQFERDFVNTKVPDDDIRDSPEKYNVAKRRALMKTTPAMAVKPPTFNSKTLPIKPTMPDRLLRMNIFNPAAWAEFIQAWKRGDFKNKKVYEP